MTDSALDDYEKNALPVLRRIDAAFKAKWQDYLKTCKDHRPVLGFAIDGTFLQWDDVRNQLMSLDRDQLRQKIETLSMYVPYYKLVGTAMVQKRPGTEGALPANDASGDTLVRSNSGIRYKRKVESRGAGDWQAAWLPADDAVGLMLSKSDSTQFGIGVVSMNDTARTEEQQPDTVGVVGLMNTVPHAPGTSVTTPMSQVERDFMQAVADLETFRQTYLKSGKYEAAWGELNQLTESLEGKRRAAMVEDEQRTFAVRRG